MDLDYTFTTTLVGDVGPGGTWVVVVMPNSFDFFGTGAAVKVDATIDGEPLSGTFMPNGEGAHLMPVRATIRKAIGKGAGDEVTIHLDRRL